MRQRHGPLVKMALRLQRSFGSRDSGHERRLQTLAEAVLYHSRRLDHQLRLGRQARSRDWPVAAAAVEQNELDLLRHLRYLLNESAGALEKPPVLRLPSLRDWHEELLALGQEFEQVRCEGGVLAVVTDFVELEEIPLGPFRIELPVDKLARRPEVSSFSIVALDPNPARGKEDITHPHVSGGILCAGDATLPIAAALREGRLCDAFVLVNQVLHTYNAGSPYVALSDWTGSSCSDCGCHVPEDEGYACERCSAGCCSDCVRFCDCCDSACCESCIETDRESGQVLCTRCQRRCSCCGRIVSPDDLHEDSQLCPQCKEARQEEEQEAQQEAEQQVAQQQEYERQEQEPHAAEQEVVAATPTT